MDTHVGSDALLTAPILVARSRGSLQVIVWTYPTMQQLATLTGHTSRVLYLAMSPDGQTVVTGAGDETLRFWNVFAKARMSRDSPSVFNDLQSQLR